MAAKYYIKKGNQEYTEVRTLYDGVEILAVSGMLEKGKAKNVYTESWIQSDTEDCQIMNTNTPPTIVRETVDLEIKFVISQKYARNSINIVTVHDNFINYMTNTDFYIRSGYANKQAHVVCNDSYKPDKVVLHHGSQSYIRGTIKVHCIEPVATFS